MKVDYDSTSLPASVVHADCCVVGGGPAGLTAALLWARRGFRTVLLEAHADFNRDFRGDTLHPAILDLMDQIGLAEKLLRIPHVKWYGPVVPGPHGRTVIADFRRLRTKYPFIMVVPQEQFLDFLAEEADRLPCFQRIMNAPVDRLVIEDDVVRGVRYRRSHEDVLHEVRATLTIGADGRFSRVRKLAELPINVVSAPVELLWFRLAKRPDDRRTFSVDGAETGPRPVAIMQTDGNGPAVVVHRGREYLVGVFDRVDYWQIAYFIPTGSYGKLKQRGLAAFQQSVQAVEPRLSEHLADLNDLHSLVPLSVAFARCPRWYRAGLLLIGDAAHVMTPAAGAGIKYAIEDAVEAVNLLEDSLRRGAVPVRMLAAVQRRRSLAVRMMQTAGALAQRFVIRRGLRPPKSAGSAGMGSPSSEQRPFPRLPLLMRIVTRLPGFSRMTARFIAYGLMRVRIKRSAMHRSASRRWAADEPERTP